ncbi:hypothetical protein AAMO2058_001444300 [Amorphochlora amoebiformis]
MASTCRQWVLVIICTCSVGLALKALLQPRTKLALTSIRFQSRNSPLPIKSRRLPVSASIVGLGSCGVDFIAQVSEYPKPDDKIRTTDFKVFGGGNAANSMCALGKLANNVKLISKVGTDANGDLIVKEAEESGVDISYVLRSKLTPSPFTYVIVDQKGQTRTCIHTPATEELTPQEMDVKMLEDCAWVHLDGRHTEAAIRLAELANEKGIPVSLDVEKDRPHLDQLMQKADIMFTNSKYPAIFCKGQEGITDDESLLLRMLTTLPRLKFVVCTKGADGSIGLMRDSKDGKLIRCPAWSIDPSSVVDTTGAGDAFIAGCIHSLSRGHSLLTSMTLGSYVAARKLTALGARAGTPSLEQLLIDAGETKDDILTRAVQGELKVGSYVS